MEGLTAAVQVAVNTLKGGERDSWGNKRRQEFHILASYHCTLVAYTCLMSLFLILVLTKMLINKMPIINMPINKMLINMKAHQDICDPPPCRLITCHSQLRASFT